MSLNALTGNSPISAADLKNVDLETAMMAVQMTRANLLESGLKDQVALVANRNREMSSLNKLMTDLRGQRPGGSNPDAKLQLKGDEANKMYQLLVDNGLPTPGLNPGIAYVPAFDLKQSDFDLISEKLKGRVDSLSSTQQMEMISVQSYNNRRNEAYDQMTNLMKKFSDARSGIARNM